MTLFWTYNSIFASLEMQLHFKEQTAFVGDRVELLCGDAVTSKDKDWHFHVPSSEGRAHKIVSDGFVTDGAFQDRLGINGSTVIIHDAKKNDSGFYFCIDNDLGVEYRYSLTVQGKILLVNFYAKSLKNKGIPAYTLATVISHIGVIGRQLAVRRHSFQASPGP